MVELFTIPYKNQHIVYRPLLRLAFAANAAMVNWIAQTGEKKVSAVAQDAQDADRFLERIGFYQPDPAPPISAQTRVPWRPDTGVLCLTNRCNLRCIYCYAAAGEDKPRTLSTAIGKKVIDTVCQNASLSGKPFFSIGFHGGGEPTVANEAFFELAGYARTKPLPVKISLTTNGCWPVHMAERILHAADDFTISWDGLPAVQNRQRPKASGEGSFNRVMQTIRLLDGAKASYGIRMTVTNDGIDHLAQSVDFLCRETGCRVIQVEPAFAQGRAERHPTILSHADRFIGAFLEAYDIAASHLRHLYYSGARPWLVTDTFCQSPQTSLVVTHEGDISACFEVINSTHPLRHSFFLGRISSATTEIRDSPARLRLLESIAARRLACRHCFCYWHCAGDCPAKSLAFHAHSDGFSSRCYLNRTLTKELIVRYMAACGGVWADTRDSH